MSLPPLNMCEGYKVSTFLDKHIKFSIKTVWHCCGLEIQSKSLRVVWMGTAQLVLPSCKVWHLSYLLMKSSEKIATLKFLPQKISQLALHPSGWPIGQSNTELHWLTFLMCNVSQKSHSNHSQTHTHTHKHTHHTTLHIHAHTHTNTHMHACACTHKCTGTWHRLIF